MKIALLAGGAGTRFAEETIYRPKPMVEIGGRPILWHIMRHFAAYGFDAFTIALGYKGDVIKRWALDLAQIQGDLRVSAVVGRVEALTEDRPDWTIDLIETGLQTNTGGRVKRLEPVLGKETFILAWGDGLSDVDVRKLVSFHRAHGKLATAMIVRPPPRFGHVALDGDQIVSFKEKPQAVEGWINGGVFVLEPGVFSYIANDETAFEKAPLENLARDGQLMAFRHEGFWQCMDNAQDKRVLDEMWARGDAPWETWKEQTCGSWLPAIAAT
ncbi:MAG: glucose-1-phosphate cytidylyltransferase [Okeania sp. SIO3H1]|nr:glucose-1-phosphate cytidylyltransferase [Okeania sp. SIO3H1]